MKERGCCWPLRARIQSESAFSSPVVFLLLLPMRPWGPFSFSAVRSLIPSPLTATCWRRRMWEWVWEQRYVDEVNRTEHQTTKDEIERVPYGVSDTDSVSGLNEQRRVLWFIPDRLETLVPCWGESVAGAPKFRCRWKGKKKHNLEKHRLRN